MLLRPRRPDGHFAPEAAAARAAGLDVALVGHDAGSLVAGLGLPFVTVDLALRADGGWRVVELGDGQVSDRPAAIAPGALIDALRTGH